MREGVGELVQPNSAMREDGGAGRPILSVIVPLFNEQDVVEILHRRLVTVLGDIADLDLEFVYVDDGSRDDTPARLAQLAAADPRICAVTLSRNFGQQAALSAGLRHCCGDVAALMDADLQDPPEVALQMLKKWREGYPVVYAVRRARPESAVLRFLCRAYYRVLALLSDVPIPFDSGDFSIIDRRVIDALNAMPEKNRFLRGLRAWYGGRQFGLVYDRAPRAAGRSKYSLRRYIRLALDGICGFSLAPLRLISLLGAILSAVAAISLLLFFFAGLLGFGAGNSAGAPGSRTLALAMVLLSGIQLLSIGVVGEYLGRIYLEVKNRPAYIAESLRPSIYAGRVRRPAGART
jgi:polyisoprenyl-phosphate glycosyltransferase